MPPPPPHARVTVPSKYKVLYAYNVSLLTFAGLESETFSLYAPYAFFCPVSNLDVFRLIRVPFMSEARIAQPRSCFLG